MTKRIGKLVFAVAALAALALGGSTLVEAGGKSSSPSRSSASPATHKRHAPKRLTHHRASARRDSAPAVQKAQDTPDQEGTADGQDADRAQTGDQANANDPNDQADAEGQGQKGGAESPGDKGESGPGAEVPNNDGPGGHADEPGNPSADHQAEGAE